MEVRLIVNEEERLLVIPSTILLPLVQTDPADRFSTTYTGRHDHGEYLPPKQVESFAVMIAFLEKAKQQTLDILAPLSSEQPKKKQRADDLDE